MPGRHNTPKQKRKVLSTIYKHLREGATIKDACILSHVTSETLYQWIKKHPDISDKIDESIHSCKRRNELVVQRAAVAGDWKAASWWLERKHKTEFAARQEVTGPGGKPIQTQGKPPIDTSNESNEEVRAAYDGLMAKSKGPKQGKAA